MPACAMSPWSSTCKAELIEDAADARGAQRVRPHQGSELRGPDLDGDPEQGDAGRSAFGHQAAFDEIVNRRVGKA